MKNLLVMDKGELVKQWRAKKGYSQQDLANATGLSRPSIARWELGTNDPQDASLRQIASVFGLTFEQFLLGPEGLAQQSTAKPNLTEINNTLEKIYIQSEIRSPNIDQQKSIGYSNILHLDTEPSRYFVVVANIPDRNPEGFPLCVRLRRYEPGDLIPAEAYLLAWIEHNTAVFTKWYPRGSSFHEPILGIVTDIFI